MIVKCGILIRKPLSECLRSVKPESCSLPFADIEAQILEIQGMKAALQEEGEQGVGLDSTGYYDQEIYGGSDSRFAGYVTSIAANEQEDVSQITPFDIILSLPTGQVSFHWSSVEGDRLAFMSMFVACTSWDSRALPGLTRQPLSFFLL